MSHNATAMDIHEMLVKQAGEDGKADTFIRRYRAHISAGECKPACFVSNFLSLWKQMPTYTECRSEWLTLLLRIREVSGSHLSPGTGYPDLCCSWFSSFPPGKCPDSTLNQATTVSFHILYHSPSSFHSTLESLSYWESVVKLTTNHMQNRPRLLPSPFVSIHCNHFRR
jgi:hypothetical protein